MNRGTYSYGWRTKCTKKDEEKMTSGERIIRKENHKRDIDTKMEEIELLDNFTSGSSGYSRLVGSR